MKLIRRRIGATLTTVAISLGLSLAGGNVLAAQLAGVSLPPSGAKPLPYNQFSLSCRADRGTWSCRGSVTDSFLDKTGRSSL